MPLVTVITLSLCTPSVRYIVEFCYLFGGKNFAPLNLHQRLLFEHLLTKTRVDVTALPSALAETLRGYLSDLRTQTYAQMLKRPEAKVESLWPVLASAMNGKPELAPWVASSRTASVSRL